MFDYLVNHWKRCLNLWKPSKKVLTERENTKELMERLHNSRELIIAKIEVEIAKKVKICNEYRMNNPTPETEAMVRRWEKRILFDQARVDALRAGKKAFDISVQQYLQNVFMTSDVIQPKMKEKV